MKTVKIEIPNKASFSPGMQESYIQSLKTAIQTLASSSLPIDVITEEIAVQRGVMIILEDVLKRKKPQSLPASPTPSCL